MIKRCRTCQVWRDAGEFATDRSRKDGLLGQCKACNKAVLGRYYREHRAERLAYYRRRGDRSQARRLSVKARAVEIYGGRCAVCGASDGLQFDHVSGDGRLHRARESSPVMLGRIAKTGAPLTDVHLQLLCVPCHKDKTRRELRERAQEVRRALVMQAWAESMIRAHRRGVRFRRLMLGNC